MQPSPCLVRVLSPHTYKLESWSVGCPEPPLVWPLQWPRFPHLLAWINDACSLSLKIKLWVPSEEGSRPRRRLVAVPQAPLLGAPPSSSVLRSLLRLPCSPPLRFSASASAVLLIAHSSPYPGRHSLPPETPPPPQTRPSRSAGDQRASRRPRGAGSRAPTEADPGEGSRPEEAGV